MKRLLVLLALTPVVAFGSGIGTNPLPAGGATAAKQDTGNASLSSIDSKTPTLVSGRQPVDGSGVTQPISAASLPLPTGAATSAKQDTEISYLAAIDVKTPSLVSGRQPVDGSGVTQPISAASLPLPTGAATATNQATGNTSLSSIDGKLPTTLGQKTMANSLAVTMASDQSAMTIGLPTDLVGTGSLTAVNQAVTLNNVNASTTALIQLSGTWVGSVQFEGSNDGFVTSTTLSTTQPSVAPSTAALTTNGDYRGLGIVNYSSIRIRCSAYTSGTIVVRLKSSAATGIQPVVSTVAAGFLTRSEGMNSAGTSLTMNSGAADAATPRVVLATRHETVSTPLAAQLSNGTTAVAYGSGASSTATLRVMPASDSPSPIGRSFADSARNAYSTTNVTTGAWVQLIASTAAAINSITLFDSCGQTLELGTGAAASETRVLLIPPGGLDGAIPLRIAAGTRVAVRAISANCTSGELVMTGLN